MRTASPPTVNVSDGFPGARVAHDGVVWLAAKGFPHDFDYPPEEGGVYRYDLCRAPTFDTLGFQIATSSRPSLGGWGCLDAGQDVCFRIYDFADAFQPGVLVISGKTLNVPFNGGVLWPTPTTLVTGFVAGPSWLEATVCGEWPVGVPAGTELVVQAFGFSSFEGEWLGGHGVRAFSP